MLPAYAELHCRSHFSFLDAASYPEELVQRAHALGYAALAITDECSLAGVVRAHGQARKLGLHLVLGAEMRLQPEAEGDEALPQAEAGPRLVLLVQSRRGWGNLSRWITLARRRAPKGSYRALRADVEGRTPTAPMLAGLPGCAALLVPEAEQSFETVFAHAMWLKTWFGPERAFIALHRLLGPDDERLQATVVKASQAAGLTVVAAGGVRMHVRSRKPLLDVLTATRLRRPLAACGLALTASAEAHLRPRARLATLFRPEWLAATVALAGQCAFSLDELRYEYPREIVPDGHTPTSWLRELTEDGARQRFPAGVPPSVRATLEHELALIAQLGYEPYFLTVADIVAWARGQGILCQGRGSAANSAVCYCLHITEVDPARASLLFERFISAERREPPDIDVDFEHQRREEVIQYIYRKYGRHRAALAAVVTSYRPRSALRDVGRALGIDADRIDAVAKAHGWGSYGPLVASPGADPAGGGAEPSAGTPPTSVAQAEPVPRAARGLDPTRLREHGFDPDSPLCRRWAALTAQLIGFPRHLSQHPGGFVIARDELSQLVPVENAAMDGRSVIQWDKDDLDAVGLIKVDILALGMLSALRRALALVALKQGIGLPEAHPNALPAFRLQDIPAEDAATYAMLSRGDSVGVFQVESRAQMSMLPRLKPARFYDLVIEVAIVRPGPIQGGMVHPYLRRRQGEEPVTYPSDEVRQALQRTLGVPIFQEQVMQLAILAADFSPGEADQLRRAMAAWKRRGGLGPFHERLVGRMVDKGYTREYAEAIFRQIEGFGEYGFPESHAASFALLVYASAWVKCHHPDAFLAALLNSQPMGFYAPAQLVRDAQAHGVEVRPVDLHESLWETALEDGLSTCSPVTAGAGAGAGSGGEGRDGGGGHGGSDGGGDGRRDGRGDGRGERPSASSRWVRGTQASAVRLHPVRLGFSRIAGLSEEAAQRIVAARGGRAGQAGFQPFRSPEDLARRAGLDAHALQLLAQADALAPLCGHRHQAAWAVAGVDTRATALLQATRTHEPAPVLAAPLRVEETLADYRSTGLSLKAHPVGLLREQLADFRIQPAAVLQGYPHGRLARASGVVTHRQRPGTAGGVVFVTLEDETGQVNVIVWPALAQAQRQPLLASRLLTVYGIWQRQGEPGREICHLVARQLVDHTPLLAGLAARSRDFH
ncbi:MAG: error-prone DNA polymerase [Rubrivivax sp.]